MNATLTYHSIDDSGSPISTPPSAFEAQLQWLGSGSMRVVSLDALSSNVRGEDNAVAITFDDGFANTKPAIERLLGHGLPVTIFVVTRHVGGTNAWGGRDHPGIPTLPLLTWADLEQLIRQGAAVEGHSRSHPRLTALSPAQLEDEVAGCQADLRERLGVRSRHLAYPYGDLSKGVEARAGGHFAFGHTTEMGLRLDGQPAMQLPRLDMYYYRRSGTLQQWGRPRFARRIAAIRTRRALKRLLTMR